jgi:hypothetical protein
LIVVGAIVLASLGAISMLVGASLSRAGANAITVGA